MIQKKCTKTIKLKLDLNKDQIQELEELIYEYTDCYNYLVDQAIDQKITSRFNLHHAEYYEVLNEFDLASAHVVTCIDVAFQSVKSWRTWCKKSKKICKIPYSRRQSIRFNKTLYTLLPNNILSIRGLDGRIKCKYVTRNIFLDKDDIKFGESTLVYDKKHNKFYFHLTVSYTNHLDDSKNKVLAIDSGINYQAVSYDGDFNIFHDGNLLKVDEHYLKLRQDLQSKGTRSSMRRLKTIASRQSRLRRDVDHCLSKSIVEYAVNNNLNTIIVEDLKNIRRTRKFSPNLNRKISMWSYSRLHTFIEYKAYDSGLWFDKVNPRNTSITCPNCGHINKQNRLDRDTFKCINCNLTGFSDYIAAYNIHSKFVGAVKHPTMQ